MNDRFARGRWAVSTRSAYRDNWREFERWCKANARQSLPATPETVSEFLQASQARGLSVSSISQRLAAIRAVHKDEKGNFPKGDPHRELYVLDDTLIADAWSEIRRNGQPTKPKAALTSEDIKRVVGGMPATKLLERAVVLVAFASALRRSEISALNREDLTFGADGLTIMVRRSKADKFGKGETVAILRQKSAFCPVAAMEAWIEHAGITSGPAFLNHHGRRMAAETVAYIVKTWAKRAGYDPRPIAAHSLRRGVITTMFANGAKIEDIMKVSRHKTISVALGYVEATKAAQNPAIRAVGL